MKNMLALRALVLFAFVCLSASTVSADHLTSHVPQKELTLLFEQENPQTLAVYALVTTDEQDKECVENKYKFELLYRSRPDNKFEYVPMPLDLVSLAELTPYKKIELTRFIYPYGDFPSGQYAVAVGLQSIGYPCEHQLKTPILHVGVQPFPDVFYAWDADREALKGGFIEFSVMVPEDGTLTFMQEQVSVLYGRQVAWFQIGVRGAGKDVQKVRVPLTYFSRQTDIRVNYLGDKSGQSVTQTIYTPVFVPVNP